MLSIGDIRHVPNCQKMRIRCTFPAICLSSLFERLKFCALTCCCLQALKDHSTLQEDRTEKQIVALLTSLLTAHEPVTVLGLSTYPQVMGLLKPEAQKVPQDPSFQNSFVQKWNVVSY